MKNNLIGQPQRSNQINVHERWEVEYWAEQLGISSEQLQRAVEAAGTSVEEVRAYLRKL